MRIYDKKIFTTKIRHIFLEIVSKLCETRSEIYG